MGECYMSPDKLEAYEAFKSEFLQQFTWDSIPPEPYLSLGVSSAFLQAQVDELKAELAELREKVRGMGGV